VPAGTSALLKKTGMMMIAASCWATTTLLPSSPISAAARGPAHRPGRLG
jgi:hypothetical protein